MNLMLAENTRLKAVNAELVAALEFFMQATQCVDMWKDFTQTKRNEIGDYARAALAKAKGE